MIRSFLDSFYQSSGLLDIAPIYRTWHEALEKQHHPDAIWLGIHDLILRRCKGGDDWAEITASVEFSESDLNEIGKSEDFVFTEVCKTNRAFDITLDVAKSVMELGAGSLSDPPYLTQALEATLWRAFDGLMAARILAGHCLLSGSHVELRAAQEALLLHGWFRQKPKSAKLFKVAGLIEELDYISTGITDNNRRFGAQSQDLLAAGEPLVAELKRLGVSVTLKQDGELIIAGTRPSSRPEWISIVTDPNATELFGTEAHKLYTDVFRFGNRSAHCLSPSWDGYARMETNSVVTMGKAVGSPAELPRLYYRTLIDFLRALETSRPQLEPVYANWAICCWLHSVSREAA